MGIPWSKQTTTTIWAGPTYTALVQIEQSVLGFQVEATAYTSTWSIHLPPAEATRKEDAIDVTETATLFDGDPTQTITVTASSSDDRTVPTPTEPAIETKVAHRDFPRNDMSASEPTDPPKMAKAESFVTMAMPTDLAKKDAEAEKRCCGGPADFGHVGRG